ncbi:MAG: hypothetical protein ABC606_06465 [Candidatus Methanosuratincola petrocarbonis]
MSKGVSEIVATVLMILLVSTIGISVFLYSMGYFSGITSARYEENSAEINAIRENFRIVDAIISNGTGSCDARFAVYNYGTIRVDLAGMYINGRQFTVQKTSVEPYQTVWFNGTFSDTVPGDGFRVRIVSMRGTAYDEVFYFSG